MRNTLFVLISLLTLTALFPRSSQTKTTPEICNNNFDDDKNGATDCNDAACSALCQNPVCGDGVVNPGEDCDSNNIGNSDCMDAGDFKSGTLSCNADCTFNTASCVVFSSCGNKIIEGDEACDSANLGGADCTDAGFASGTLSCAADCTFDTSSCTGDQPTFALNR